MNIHTYQTTGRFHLKVDGLYTQWFYLDCIVFALHHIKQTPYFHQDLMLATKQQKLRLIVFVNVD